MKQKTPSPNFKDITLIIPFFNEADNVELVISESLEKLPDVHIIAVDDGSSDQTYQNLEKFKNIQIIKLQKNCGQSTAMLAGLAEAKTKWVATMDGDGQNNPEDLTKMIKKINTNSVICGWRVDRKDTFFKKDYFKIG